jgi:hypothetical protein
MGVSREPTDQDWIEEAEAKYGITGLRGRGNRQLYIVELADEYKDHPHDVLQRHPGAMWRWPERDMPGRECWVIKLPKKAGAWWTTFRAPDNSPGGTLWKVEGVPPLITVTPSINAGENHLPYGWHGHIKNGLLSP